MHVLQVHHVELLQFQWDRCTMYRSMKGTRTRCITYDVDGKLPFKALKNLLFNPYITHWMWWPTSYHIPWNVTISRSRLSTERNVWRFGILRLGYFSLLTAPVAFPLHPPSTKCMSVNSINKEPRSMLDASNVLSQTQIASDLFEM